MRRRKKRRVLREARVMTREGGANSGDCREFTARKAFGNPFARNCMELRLEEEMPKINGRYYANPAYGRGLERARSAEAALRHYRREDRGDWERNPVQDHFGEERLFTQEQHAGHRHASVGHNASTGGDHYDPAKSIAGVANQIYNETSGLRPTSVNGPGSDFDLQQARKAMAHVIQNRRLAGRHGGLASPEILSRTDARDIPKMGTPAYDAHGESEYAAHRARHATIDPTNNATEFYLSSGHGSGPVWSNRPRMSFGPFTNIAGGGDVQKNLQVRILIGP
ncbi:MAG: hypothetical protein ACRD4M_09705 [Candidatus Acidiferrales bacterium]